MVENGEKTVKLDYDHFLGRTTANRRSNPLRDMSMLWMSPRRPPDTIPLFGGIPNPDTIPFRAVTVEVAGGTVLEVKVSSRCLPDGQETNFF